MKNDLSKERAWWDAKAPLEETDKGDEAVNRALRWREIEKHLDGVKTILDVGAGTGAFSIPLAGRGFQVTHYDHSRAMLDLAREAARGVEGITFEEGDAGDLSCFADRRFDLVLNMDGAISFSGERAGTVLSESCRVAGKKLIVTVSHRANLSAFWVTWSLRATGRFVPAVHTMMERGEWHQDQFPENATLTKGFAQDYLGAIKAYLPAELSAVLKDQGLNILRCGGLGSLAQLCDPSTLETVLEDEALMGKFLNLCEKFDDELLPDGPGTFHRAGLIAVAVRPENRQSPIPEANAPLNV